MPEVVEIFPWNNNFATGIAVVDGQHKKLVSLLNLLVSHLVYQSDVPTLTRIFDELKEYTVYHFSTEQEIWDKHFHDDDWAHWHKDSHDDFIAGVIRMTEQQGSKPFDELLEDIVKFLTHWLAYHILESDKRMAKVVLALPTGVSLAQAKKQADEEMSGSARVLIETLMTMYDMVANRTVRLTREIAKRKQIEEELALARQAAEEANEAKSRFLANLSHEIRTPMNAILGMAHLLSKQLSVPEHKDKLLKIEESANHLLVLVNDILDISRIEANAIELDASPFSLQHLFDKVESLMGQQVRGKQLALNIDLPDSLARAWIVGDQLRIAQILVNFLGNATKFTQQGQIDLRARLLEEQAGQVTLRFEVSDTGIGISEADRERIFHAFEQADASTTRKYGGSGLGLAISQKLVLLMGGEIGVESRLGEGSTFWFSCAFNKAADSIKATTLEEDKTMEAPGNAGKVKAGARILLVEDNEINQEVAKSILEDFGLSVEVASDGEEAVNRAKDHDFDLILMDMQMPVMNGLDASKQLRLLGKIMPIIAMTANAFVEDQRNCLDAGMNDFLTKPVHPDRMLATLGKWIPEK